MATNAERAVSKGFLRALFDGPGGPETNGQTPVLQVCQIAQMQQDKSRWRIVLSDVDNYVQGMLATQISHLAESEQLKQGCFVKLKAFTANAIKAKRVLIVVDLEVLPELGIIAPKLGEPKPLALKGDSATAPAPQGQQPAAMSGQGFYGNQVKQEQKYQPQQSLPSRSAPSTVHGSIYPIEALSPYAHKWTIKARVTSKSDIKEWHNKNGHGKLFSVNLLDESGEIKATGFNDQCDAYYQLFEEGQVYYISSPCRVQMAKKQFSNLNNDYELTFERETVVEKCEEQDDVPQVRYNFTNIADIANVDKDAVVDTIGVVKEVGEVNQIISKTTSKPYDKRELNLVDNTNFSIRLTIWGNGATSFDAPPDSVIAFKGVKVSDFGGRSLSLLSSGTMSVNPDIDEAHRLKGWYDAAGRDVDYSNHEAMRGAATASGTGRGDPEVTVEQIKTQQLGMGDEADYFVTKATVIYIKNESFAYPACPSPAETNCNRKVTEEPDGTWRCERCSKNWPKPEYRYIMSMNVADHTGQIWMSCFDDVGKLLMGMEANRLLEMKEAGEDRQEQQAFAEATWGSYNFKCRAKMDTYQDQQRVRYQIIRAEPVRFAAESKKLIEVIKSYGDFM